ncbi:DUF6526 family protein [Roseisolibacter sp. H3M3-2]|uniref:DUF6526 family protein n=1 Tax=Roseisolibacter sp. H3M3-2 TaxID=3031323 RepID=UPI0023DC949F|nr:DUF6526 family protein [Roseisolibacter sp. H3M3-2]MDF1502892.1 DUF6526 family protein [Roseisolibacter sp. H3M3-2]
MAPTSSRQHYGSHRRWNPLVHFVLSPLLLVNVGVAFTLWRRAPTVLAAWGVATAVLLLLLNVAARQQALTVQNRVIRLEMWWRLARVLPPDLAARVHELRLGQLVGLRFASDAELPALVRRCLAGELPTSDAVKRAVRDWQPDTLRA